MDSKTVTRFLCSLLILMLAAGCSSRGPLDKRELPSGNELLNMPPAVDAVTLPAWTRRWIEQIPTLEPLLKDVIQNNPEVAQARARLEQSMANVAEVSADRYPDLSVAGNALAAGSDTSNRLGLALNAEYALGLGGAERYRVQSALLAAGSETEALAALQWRLLITVIQLHIDRLEASAQRRISERSLALVSELKDFMKRRYQAGMIQKLELVLLQQQVREEEQSLAAAEQREAQLTNALAELAGHSIETMTIKPINPEDALTTLKRSSEQALPTFDNKSFYQSRPDIREAEKALLGADADVRVARSALYPEFRVTGEALSEASSLGSLFSVPQLTSSLVLELAQTLFDGGQREARIEFQQAGFKENMETLRLAAVNAAAEVELALLNINSLQRQQAMAEERRTFADEAFRISQANFEAGLLDTSRLIDAQQDQLEAQEEILMILGSLARQLVQLDGSVGGDRLP